MMKLNFSIFLSVIIVILAEEIEQLPGLNFKVYSRHFSGYLNVSNTHRLHYWFVESQNTPSVDPLVFWFEGGPGCSSIIGLADNNGPFLFESPDVNDTFRRNEHTWNRKANIVYLSSPAGTGFSYSTDGNITTNDDLTADENYEAVKLFLKEFPSFRDHDLYLTGESYGGIYIPMLATRIIDGQQDYPINLKGIAIGNGAVYLKIQPRTSLFYSYHHGLVSEREYRRLVNGCCNGKLDTCEINLENSYCQEMKEMGKPKVFLDYDISQKCYNRKDEAGGFPDCDNYEKLAKIVNYFVEENVRKALFIPSEAPEFSLCSNQLMRDGEYRQGNDDMSKYFLKIVAAGVRTLLFYGDQDKVCDFIMGQQFVAKLNITKIRTKEPWFVNKIVAGYKTVYSNLTFMTIRGAGHSAAKTRPVEMYEVIQEFFNGAHNFAIFTTIIFSVMIYLV